MQLSSSQRAAGFCNSRPFHESEVSALISLKKKILVFQSRVKNKCEIWAINRMIRRLFLFIQNH